MIPQFEDGVNTIDPLAGSYFVEALTARMEKEAQAYFERIDALGGVIPAIEQGFFQREIADAAYRYQMELDMKQKTIVGVNNFVEENERVAIPLLEISPEVEGKQRKRIAEVRAGRSPEDVRHALHNLSSAAAESRNLLPALLECAHAYVTLGEMCSTLAEVFGLHEETAAF